MAPPVVAAVVPLTLTRRLATVPTRGNRTFVGLVGPLVLAIVYVLVIATGGQRPELADLAYIPILLWASWFGVAGGLGMGAAAGLVIGLGSPPGLYPQGNSALNAAGMYVVAGGLAGAMACLLRQRWTGLTELNERLDRAYGTSLRLIAESVELRDPDTAGHSERVAQNARTLGARIGLTGYRLDVLYWAGLLHDVGKIAVPESVLHEPGRLSPQQWAVMTSHAAIGADLVAQTSTDFAVIALAVRSHHERWDGGGYPDRLEAEGIPIEARLLAVVDVFEAMTCVRPYRDPISPAQALDHLHQQSGTHFDPALVEAFQQLYEERAIALASPPVGPTTQTS